MTKVLEELRSRFDALEPRERRFLLAGALAVLAALVFFALLRPVHEYRDDLAQRLDGQRELVSWMRGAAKVLQSRGPSRQAPASEGSLLAMMDSSARNAGLGNSLSRMQQDGDNAVRARLESASFDDVIIWLETLQQRHGVLVSEMSVERAGEPGRINASLTLTRAGS